MAQRLIVNISVCDLTSEPVSLNSKNYCHEPLRLTQLLFGEKLYLLEERQDFFKVQALEQLNYSQERRWHPYEGWVQKKDVTEIPSFLEPNSVVISTHLPLFPFGTYVHSDFSGRVRLPNEEKVFLPPLALRPLNKSVNRREIVQDAFRFLKLPYLWGGRGFPMSGSIASVDCSGLVNLIYRAQGVQIPRDAHPQFLFGSKVERVLEGDTVYLSPIHLDNEKVTHVIIKGAGPYYIEAPETGKHVRLLYEGKDIWQKNNLFYFQDRPHAYRPFFTSFLG